VFIKSHRQEFPVMSMCSVLAISKSGFYAWLKRELKPKTRDMASFDVRVKAVFEAHHGRYGSPRITRQLQAEGVTCSHTRVERSMKRQGLHAVVKKQFRCTTDSNHHLPVFDNILDRDFTTTAVNQKWVGDITYCATNEGWLYIATILDLHSRAVIGWAMDKHMKASLVCDALMMALFRTGFPQGVILHHDRGSQYCSHAYRNLIDLHQLTGSMSRRGNCWDNAVAESFFHTLKNELIHQRHFNNREQAKQEVFDYIETYYNRKRLHSTIDYRTPAEVQWCA